jgi:hypothetical protein
MRSHILLVCVATAALCLRVADAAAHCDGLDGPVVTAAREALQSGDLRHVLVWVQKRDEDEVRRAFDRALAVRKLGAEARQLADEHFFETVVRLHRAGEGAPYTGLKPAGRDLGPAIPAADRALHTGRVEPLVRLLTEAVAAGTRDRFHRARQHARARPGDVEAGRAYIAAYVAFVHYVEAVYQASRLAAHGHYPETEAASQPHH